MKSITELYEDIMNEASSTKSTIRLTFPAIPQAIKKRNVDIGDMSVSEYLSTEFQKKYKLKNVKNGFNNQITFDMTKDLKWKSIFKDISFDNWGASIYFFDSGDASSFYDTFRGDVRGMDKTENAVRFKLKIVNANQWAAMMDDLLNLYPAKISLN